jgi:hypothetical protein
VTTVPDPCGRGMVPVVDVADLPRGAHYEGQTSTVHGNPPTHRIYSRRNGALVAVDIVADRARIAAKAATS